MKKVNYIFIAVALVVVVTLIAVYITDLKWLLLLGAAFLLGIYCMLSLQRRQYEKQLEMVSQTIENLLADRENQVPPLSDAMIPKMQNQLLRLQSMVEAQRHQSRQDNEEIRTLITEIAHQLRVPLANTETYLELLKDTDLKSDQRQYLEAASISEKQIGFLIESLIKMARLETRMIQIKKTDTDLKETILNCIFKEEKSAGERNIQITFDSKGHMPVLHDKNWLGEAVSNLLDNSIKYSPEGGTVEVSLIQNDMFAQIQVRDYGIGIEEGEENLILKRFYRGKKVTGQKGFGLGMYISGEIAAKHQGFMKVVREKNGLSCSLFLPLGEKR